MIVRPPVVSPAHKLRLKRTITRLLDRAHEQAERTAIGLHRTIITQNGTLNPPVIPDGVGDWVGAITANVLMKIRGTPVSGVAPLDGQVLVFNEDAGEWQPGAPGDASGEIVDYSTLVNEARTVRGATFSASSTSGDASQTAAFAADTDDSTYWLSAAHTSPADPADAEWWKADLGSAKEITWYRVVQASPTQFRSTSSKLQSSTDNTNWTDRVTFGVFGDSGLDELASPVTARYWRVLGVDMDPLPFLTNYWGLATVALYSGQPTTASAGHTIEDEGSALAQRTSLNFTGGGVSVADSGGKTVVTIAGGSVATAQDLSAEVDGAETVFTLDFPYATGSTQVYLNGLLQRPGGGNSYTETGGGTTITFATAPASGDELLVVYNLASGGTGAQAPADLYVDPTDGSDTTGDGSLGDPYATVAKALSVLPTVLAAEYTIHLADDTYAEAIDLRGFVGADAGALTLTGNTTTPANVTFTGTATDDDGGTCVALVAGPLRVELEGVRVNATATSGVRARDGARLTLDRCTVTGTLNHGVHALNGAVVDLLGAVTVSGFSEFGLDALHGSAFTTSGAATLTLTGATSAAWGVHLFAHSRFITYTASVAITISTVKYGFQVGLNSLFQHRGSSGSISVTNASTPASSAGVQCTDLSSWSTDQAITFDHLNRSWELNSISYAESTGSRTLTNITTGNSTTQNSVLLLA